MPPRIPSWAPLSSPPIHLALSLLCSRPQTLLLPAGFLTFESKLTFVPWGPFGSSCGPTNSPILPAPFLANGTTQFHKISWSPRRICLSSSFPISIDLQALPILCIKCIFKYLFRAFPLLMYIPVIASLHLWFWFYLFRYTFPNIIARNVLIHRSVTPHQFPVKT